MIFQWESLSKWTAVRNRELSLKENYGGLLETVTFYYIPWYKLVHHSFAEVSQKALLCFTKMTLEHSVIASYRVTKSYLASGTGLQDGLLAWLAVYTKCARCSDITRKWHHHVTDITCQWSNGSKSQWFCRPIYYRVLFQKVEHCCTKLVTRWQHCMTTTLWRLAT